MQFASPLSLRVDPELRQAAEALLREGESLSSLMGQALCDHVSRQQFQREFVIRGLASRDEARRTGEYFDAASVYAELRGMLATSSSGKAKQ